jgi:hypothetical protein
MTNNVGRACPSSLGMFLRLLRVSAGCLHKSHGGFEDAPHVTTGISSCCGEEALACFGSKVRFLDFAFCGVLWGLKFIVMTEMSEDTDDIWKI